VIRLRPDQELMDDAEFSADGLERLWLSRKLPQVGPVGLCIGLNPSKAGASEDDPTVRKVKGFGTRWGWGGFWMANLFTCIETYSAKLKTLSFESAVGKWSDATLVAMLEAAPEIVVCWGTAVPKNKQRRIAEVSRLIAEHKRPEAPVWCLGLSLEGEPLHPSRLGYSTQRVAYEVRVPVSRR